MCIQAYYNYKEKELELDLLSEIKRLGVKKWKEKVRQQAKQGQFRKKQPVVKTEK